MFGKKLIAVDIGNKYIKLVNGEANKDSFIIKEYDLIETPANVIRDGKIINLEVLANTLRDSLSRNKIHGRNLVLNITGTGVITRDIQIPRSTDAEIEKMLEFEAQQYFPVDLENYVLDFKAIENFDNEEGSFTRVLLVAVPMKQVEEYMKLPGLLKMEVAAIDLPVNCLSKFLFGRFSLKAKAETNDSEVGKEFAVIDIGAETTGVSIFSGGKLRFSRILLNGSNDIDRLISNNFNIDIKEAEIRKISQGILTSDSDNVGDNQNAYGIEEVVRKVVDNIISDINRLFEFYNSRSTSNRLDKIILCGGGSRINGISEYFKSYFNIPVETLDSILKKKVLYKGKRKKDEFEKDFDLFINTIGALVR